VVSMTDSHSRILVLLDHLYMDIFVIIVNQIQNVFMLLFKFPHVRSGPTCTYLFQNCYAMPACAFHSLAVTGRIGRTCPEAYLSCQVK
jgi:hypothetical protein